MKRVTAHNWLEADPASQPGGLSVQVWRDRLLAVQLAPGVPDEVAHRFETARGCMIHGAFFAPLVNLGVEQCYRALELGLRARGGGSGLAVAVQDRQGRAHALSFSHLLRQLAQHGLIATADLPLWQQAGELRHWDAQTGQCLGLEHGLVALERAAELLERLFSELN